MYSIDANTSIVVATFALFALSCPAVIERGNIRQLSILGPLFIIGMIGYSYVTAYGTFIKSRASKTVAISNGVSEDNTGHLAKNRDLAEILIDRGLESAVLVFWRAYWRCCTRDQEPVRE